MATSSEIHIRDHSAAHLRCQGQSMVLHARAATKVAKHNHPDSLHGLRFAHPCFSIEQVYSLSGQDSRTHKDLSSPHSACSLEQVPPDLKPHRRKVAIGEPGRLIHVDTLTAGKQVP